ncbi:MAG: hypothetical protein M1818_004053 [Claussenomyces sp. TS43310]|nr:MAG: hypothetical protein M1818_004053 [Claussenomyces sp. TS43310]
MPAVHDASGPTSTPYIWRIPALWLCAAYATIILTLGALLLSSFRRLRRAWGFTGQENSPAARFDKMAVKHAEDVRREKLDGDEVVSERRLHASPERRQDADSASFSERPRPTIQPEERSEMRQPGPEGPRQELPVPRRRSYTKDVEGVEVEGEIIVADGWSRHTRVYGGGVCQACLESERKALALEHEAIRT